MTDLVIKEGKALRLFLNPQETFKKITLEKGASLHLFYSKPLSCEVSLFEKSSFFSYESSSHGVSEWTIDLLEKEASSSLYGLYRMKEKEQLTTKIAICHHAASTSSTQYFKALLEDESRFHFDSDVLITPEAIHSIADQKCKSLLLSNEAKATSNPHLRIHTDEVKASHGVAIATPDESSLFYLTSRGLDKKEALSLFAKAFCQELLDKMESL